jgi:hypothetical protein
MARSLIRATPTVKGAHVTTNRARRRIGHRFEIDGNLGTALRKNESVAEIEVPDRDRFAS